MTRKVEIKDISTLRITKVELWKIYFECDGKKYMLLEDGEEDAHISLYERIKVENGHHKVVFMNGAITCMHMRNFIKDISKRKPTHLVYANIDRNYFVIRLLELDFSSGYLEDRHNEFELIKQEKINKINEVKIQLDKLNKELSELKADEHNLPTLASKEARGNKIKAEVANRVKGAEPGEWCEEYKAYYGESDKTYGGTLTDLFSLLVGTHIWVTNGNYDAYIAVDSHGDKCIVTDNSCVKLTKQHHSAYIEL